MFPTVRSLSAITLGPCPRPESRRPYGACLYGSIPRGTAIPDGLQAGGGIERRVGSDGRVTLRKSAGPGGGAWG